LNKETEKNIFASTPWKFSTLLRTWQYTVCNGWSPSTYCYFTLL